MPRPIGEIHEDLSEVRQTIRVKVRARAKARQLLDRLNARLPKLRRRKTKLKREAEKAKRGRTKPNIVVDRNVRNQSSRGGAKVRLLVLHSTESDERAGKADLEAIADWFDNPAAQASSHVITDADGTSARCVPDAEKAWTQAGFNPYCLSIEQIGRASQSSWDEDELRETARWLAKWSRDQKVPLVRGAVSGSSITRAGVVTHKQLGAYGGGHVDPGEVFPVDRVIELAKDYR